MVTVADLQTLQVLQEHAVPQIFLIYAGYKQVILEKECLVRMYS